MADTTRTVKAKFDGDTSGLRRAARDGEREVDRFTKSADKKFRKSGDDTSKSFTSRFGGGLKKWFRGDGDGLFKEIGKSGGTVFGSGLLGALKTPILGPALVATVGAVVATTMPAVGALAGTALVAGFGAGLVGLGITFAAKSDRVKKSWADTLDDMGDDMTLLSRPFEDTLVKMSGFARRTFARFRPELGEAFRGLAPEITAFGDEATRALEGLAPVIVPVGDAFSYVLRSLGPSLQSAVDDTSDGLVELAESVKENPDALADLTKGVGDLVHVLLGGITTLNNINGQIEDLTGGLSGVDIVMGGLKGVVAGSLGPFTALEKGLDAVGLKADKMTHSVEISADTAKLWTQGLDQNQLALLGITGAAAGAASKVEDLTTKYNRQKARTDALLESSFRLQNLLLGLAGAEINYQSAIDDATQSIKDHGRTTNINTEAGRANKSALLQVASAANQQTQAMVQNNKGLGAATKSAQRARSNFVTLAQKMGISKTEAKRMADALIGIPKDTKAKVSAPGARGAKADVDGLARSIRLLPNYKTIQIRYTERGVNLTTPSSVGRRASGGEMFPGTRYLVGERRPEVVDVDQNGRARVISGEQTPRELASSNQPIIVENRIEIGGEVVRVVRSELKADKRALNRTVMAGVR